MESQVSRAEHEEYKQRINDRSAVQDKRLDRLEEEVDDLRELVTSVEKLAINMQHMLEEQVSQGKRLEVLESRDGEMWRKVIAYVITSLIGIVIGCMFK